MKEGRKERRKEGRRDRETERVKFTLTLPDDRRPCLTPLSTPSWIVSPQSWRRIER